MLKSDQVLNLAVLAGKPGPVRALSRAYLGGSRGGPGSGVDMLPASQRQLLQDLEATPPAPAPQTYNHPGNGITAQPLRGPLSASEVAWLQTLPKDREEMSWDDAHQLAQLIADLSVTTDPTSGRFGSSAPGTVSKLDRNPGDLRLLHALYDPVREQHDIEAAEVLHANAQIPLPAVPSSALGALATSIGSENDQLRPDEALGRASATLQDALSKREAARQVAVAAAADKLEAALAAPINRKSTAR